MEKKQGFMQALESAKGTIRTSVAPREVQLEGIDVKAFKKAVAGMSGSAVLVSVELARTALNLGTSKAQCKKILELAGSKRKDVAGHWGNMHPFKGIRLEKREGLIYAYKE